MSKGEQYLVIRALSLYYYCCSYKENFIIAYAWHAKNLYFISACNNRCEIFLNCYLFNKKRHSPDFYQNEKTKIESVSGERLRFLNQCADMGGQCSLTRVLSAAYLQYCSYCH